jgi:hypothetical protein
VSESNNLLSRAAIERPEQYQYKEESDASALLARGRDYALPITDETKRARRCEVARFLA